MAHPVGGFKLFAVATPNSKESAMEPKEVAKATIVQLDTGRGNIPPHTSSDGLVFATHQTQYCG